MDTIQFIQFSIDRLFTNFTTIKSTLYVFHIIYVYVYYCLVVLLDDKLPSVGFMG